MNYIQIGKNRNPQNCEVKNNISLTKMHKNPRVSEKTPKCDKLAWNRIWLAEKHERTHLIPVITPNDNTIDVNNNISCEDSRKSQKLTHRQRHILNLRQTK